MSKRYYIFGAHSRAQTLGVYLRELEPEREIIAYIIDNEEENPHSIEGVPVIRLTESSTFDHAASVYLAVRGIYHEIVKMKLKVLGFKEIIPVTPEMDIILRNKYVKKEFDKSGKRFYKLDHDFDSYDFRKEDKRLDGREKVCVYVPKILNDHEISKSWKERPYECIVQAGAGLTDERLSDVLLCDNEGEEISKLNSQFSELTVLYWIWKNTKQEITGLEHWRRRFLLPNNWIEQMDEKNIDVILPVPLCVIPSLEDNYRARHFDYIWDEMLNVVLELYPSEYERIREYFKSNTLYSPCNMFIARRNVMEIYCEWLFPILFEVHKRIGVVDDCYQNRYPGFLSERLLTYFFDVHGNEYNVVYSDKNFLM